MKLMLYNKREPIIFLEANIHATRISIKDFEIMCDLLPDDFSFLQSEDKIGEKCYRLSSFLSRRVSEAIKKISPEEFHDILMLKKDSFSVEEIEQYLFLISLLNGLCTEEDSYSVHPLQTEYLRFFNKDERFTTIYQYKTI